MCEEKLKVCGDMGAHKSPR